MRGASVAITRTHMMTFDYGGDGEPIWGTRSLVGTIIRPCRMDATETEKREALCCFSAQPPDLANMISAWPEAACVRVL